VSWTSHPARHRPATAILVALLLAGVLVGMQTSWGEWILTALAGLILGGAVAPFYLPTRYAMDDEQILCRTLTSSRKKPWARFRRAVADRHGVLLSPYDRPTRLDRYHGLNLRFDPPDRDRVLRFVGERVPLEVADGR
jgi:hypothetical protein